MSGGSCSTIERLQPALERLIAYAKTNPGKLNYASYGTASQPYLAMEILKSLAGIDIVLDPYKVNPQAVPAALTGEVQLTFSEAASSQAHIFDLEPVAWSEIVEILSSPYGVLSHAVLEQMCLPARR